MGGEGATENSRWGRRATGERRLERLSLLTARQNPVILQGSWELTEH